MVAAYHDHRRLDAQQVSDLLIPAVQRPRAAPRRHAHTLASTHRIDGQADAANHRITDALSAEDAKPDPGDEADGNTEQSS
jgi:hypothetical protein